MTERTFYIVTHNDGSVETPANKRDAIKIACRSAAKEVRTAKGLLVWVSGYYDPQTKEHRSYLVDRDGMRTRCYSH